MARWYALGNRMSGQFEATFRDATRPATIWLGKGSRTSLHLANLGPTNDACLRLEWLDGKKRNRLCVAVVGCVARQCRKVGWAEEQVVESHLLTSFKADRDHPPPHVHPESAFG